MKIILLLAALLISCIMNAQTNGQEIKPYASAVKEVAIAKKYGKTNISGLTLYVNQGYYSSCIDSSIRKFEVVSLITVDGAGLVEYKWTRSDGAEVNNGKPDTAYFDKAGTYMLKTTWSVGLAFFQGGMEMITRSENTVISNRVQFGILCPVPKEVWVK